MRIEHVQPKGGGTLDLGTVHTLFVADAQLIAAIAELLSLLVLGSLKVARRRRHSASIACLWIQAIAALLLLLLLLLCILTNAVLATTMQYGRQWLLLLVIIQRDIAQFQLAAHILGILDIDTLVGTRVIPLWTAWPAVHHTCLFAVTDLFAADLLAFTELVDAALVVTVWFGGAPCGGRMGMRMVRASVCACVCVGAHVGEMHVRLI